MTPCNRHWAPRQTYSVDFPTSPAAFQPKVGGGGADAFATKFNLGDRTPPACALTRVIAGPQKALQITIQDSHSGLKRVKATAVSNATVSIPTFAVGTTRPVVVTVTNVDQTTVASVTLQATDLAGNVTTCDPAMVTVTAGAGKPVSKVVSGVAQAESRVSIYNKTPGLKRIDVTVNGKRFRITRLLEAEVRTIDVAAGLEAGNNNTIVLPLRGTSGSAEVLIAEPREFPPPSTVSPPWSATAQWEEPDH